MWSEELRKIDIHAVSRQFNPCESCQTCSFTEHCPRPRGGIAGSRPRAARILSTRRNLSSSPSIMQLRTRLRTPCAASRESTGPGAPCWRHLSERRPGSLLGMRVRPCAPVSPYVSQSLFLPSHCELFRLGARKRP